VAGDGHGAFGQALYGASRVKLRILWKLEGVNRVGVVRVKGFPVVHDVLGKRQLGINAGLDDAFGQFIAAEVAVVGSVVSDGCGGHGGLVADGGLRGDGRLGRCE
jgi:hypothetical protein